MTWDPHSIPNWVGAVILAFGAWGIGWVSAGWTLQAENAAYHKDIQDIKNHLARVVSDGELAAAKRLIDARIDSVAGVVARNTRDIERMEDLMRKTSWLVWWCVPVPPRAVIDWCPRDVVVTDPQVAQWRP